MLPKKVHSPTHKNPKKLFDKIVSPKNLTRKFLTPKEVPIDKFQGPVRTILSLIYLSLSKWSLLAGQQSALTV